MSDPTPTIPASLPTTTTHEIPPAANGPVKFFKRGSKKSTTRKRAPTPPSASSGSDSESDTNAPKKLIKRAKTSTVTASSTSDTTGPTQIGAIYTSTSSTIDTLARDAATKSNDWYDETSAALLGRKKKRDSTKEDEEAGAASTYKGAAGYGNFIKKPENAAPKHVGPLKASSNVRTITITDYAPDVCKDYKQTGFCGFGDTCKFLHAREDYAAGWKLDRDWEIGKDGKRKPGGEGGKVGEDLDEEGKELEGIPFKCVLCKEDYKAPIKTKCGHYFCESCAIQRYKKNPGCRICGKRTDGVFNAAKNLRAKLKRKEEREEEKRKKEEEEKEKEGK